MAEIVSIVGADEAAVEARLVKEKEARPGLKARVIRRDLFKKCALRVVRSEVVKGNDGQGYRYPRGDVYALVVEFS